MKTQIRSRPVGATVLAIVFGWLGVGGLLNAVGWPLLRSSSLFKSAPPDFVEKFPPLLGSLELSLIALAYGISALVVARDVWRMSASALASYVVWAAIALAFAVWLSIGVGFPVVSMVLLLAGSVVFFATGWLVVRRVVRR